MPRRAIKDTFATEAVGPDLEIRRKVFAGQEVPDHYSIEKSAVEDAEGGNAGYPHEYTTGHGGTPHGYKGAGEARAKRGSKAKE